MTTTHRPLSEANIGPARRRVGVSENFELPIPSGSTAGLYANNVGPAGRLAGRDDKGGDAFMDFRRQYGPELSRFRAALANRDFVPANIYMLGDSISEGGGATEFARTWAQLMRDALQREYRPGGIGWIPAALSSASLFPNPWSYVGTPDFTDFGNGFGRRGVLLDATADKATLTFTGDRIWIVYTGVVGAGTMKVTLDGVASTQSTVLNITKSGAIWDSGQLVRGTHTIVVEPNAVSNSILLDGAFVFDTDYTGGVHVWNGGHGGHRAEHYNGDQSQETFANQRARWADTMFQPHTVFDSGGNNVTANGTTTLVFTGTSPAFTSDDIGEVVYGSIDNESIPRGLRIVSVTNGTTIVVNKTVPAGSIRLAFTRARVTDAVRTIGSNTVTSAAADFNPWDVGKTISGTGLVDGTVIKEYVNESTVEVFPVAFSSGSGGTLQIKNRQRYPARPDLLMVQFGGNELFLGKTKAEFKTDIEAIYDTCLEYANIDQPGQTGIYTDERPSVALLTYWSFGWAADTNLVISTTSGSNVVGKATTGTIRETRFTAADIGKTLFTTGNTPIPASTTITGLTGTPDQFGNFPSATISNNALSTQTNQAAVLLQRVTQDSQWHDYRSAANELAEANGWAHIDLYGAAGGYVSVQDYPSLVCKDGLHPNKRGQLLIADVIALSIGGVKRLASIPQGLGNNPGEIIMFEAADVAAVKPGRAVLAADVATGTTVGTFTATSLTWPIGPGEAQCFTLVLFYTSGAATTGLQVRLAGSAGMSTPATFIQSALGVTSATAVAPIGSNAPQAWPQVTLTATGGLGSTTNPTPLVINGYIVAGAVGGTITVEVGPEVAGNITTVRKGSNRFVY